MKRESTPPVPVTESRILFYQSEDGTSRIEVRLEEGTVWLPQILIAELYQTTKQNISLHIRNIFDEGELQPEATVKEYLTVHVPSLRARELLVDPHHKRRRLPRSHILSPTREGFIQRQLSRNT